MMLDMVLTKRGRSRWEWRVHNPSGKVVMSGWENSRPEAKYQGERALFLILMTTGRIYDPPQTT
jgi:hypothetical protein